MNAKRNKKSGRRKARIQHDVLRGRAFRPSATPPVIQQGHWNNAVVSHRSGGDVELSINDICNQLRDQYGLFATDSTNRIPISVRLLDVKCWVFDTITPQPYQLLVRNLIDFAEQARLQEFPACNAWGRVGYVWPVSQQLVQHNHSDTTNKPVKLDVTSSVTWLLQIGLLWRPLNGQSFTESMNVARSLASDGGGSDTSYCVLASPEPA